MLFSISRFEDGTVSFLDIISLRHGFQALDSLAGWYKLTNLKLMMSLVKFSLKFEM